MSDQPEDLKAELERLKAENESLKQTRKTTGSMSFKVSEKERCRYTASAAFQ